METFTSGATLIEAALLSFLLALWMTWMGLRGLFLLMPARRAAIGASSSQPNRLVANRHDAIRRREGA